MPLDPEKAAARSRRYEESPKGKAYIGGVTIIDVPSREEALRRDRDRGREAHVVRALADAFGNAGGKPEDLQALIVPEGTWVSTQRRDGRVPECSGMTPELV